ncbi:hypothetical protein ACFPYI_13775 [Halomarina salina]|uniref:MarR family transcriptional regulator n=1 Tax=Halomarina salina TaxID=1872699 RepID=A0ABD5RQ55_9EURY|nr:hypothetical protein [Halomarina salina]
MTIDKTARRILAVLGEHGELSGPTIASRLVIGSGSVSHAMREHLLSRGLVEVVRTEENPGSAADTHHYRLTGSGEGWLAEHTDEVSIDSLDDLQDGVAEAIEAAESAKESVQGYRTKVNRVNARSKENKARIDDIDDDYVPMTELLRSQSIAVDHADDVADDVHARIDKTQEDTREALQRLVPVIQNRIDQSASGQAERIDGLTARIDELEETVADQQERINELESRRFF